MDTFESLRASLANAFSQLGTQLAEYAPKLLGAALLLLVGWLIARLLRGLAVKLMHVLELVLHRLWRGPAGKTSALPSASVEIVGTILIWVVIVFFAAATANVLGLDAFSSWLKDLMAYLPTLFAGLVIILAGVLLSGFARDLTVAALAALPEIQRLQISRLVQGAILVTAVVMGADQIGIEITFLVVLAAVTTSAIIGGVALAVSLGARTYVANLIGAHYLRHAFEPGQRVRIGALEGTILELTAVSVVLETEQGRASVPAKVYNEDTILLLAPKATDA
ncbi:MAG: mechanosensitive ion channel family protein [Betaproteobacteria bacterium]|nr:MAG: mechanosensitive ion channel family protein [Betaproteobacteria bacterium]